MQQQKKIGIVGGGFSGISLAAKLHQLNPALEIFIFDRSGQFGAGYAYSTPYLFHLLNVRAKDMSVYEDDPLHFVEWLKKNAKQYPINLPPDDQFVPRFYYYHYLQSVVASLKNQGVHFIPSEVVKTQNKEKKISLYCHDDSNIEVDSVVLALGNNPPNTFPFPIVGDIKQIINPWDYRAIEKIGKQEPVLLIGTGLSTIDAILTLYNQHHQGPIYALSRHGLLPLPHANQLEKYDFDPAAIPLNVVKFMQYLRKIAKENPNWQSIIHALRSCVPEIWQKMDVANKKRFIRHAMSYWNVHRHRIPQSVFELIQKLQNSGQLNIIAGRVIKTNDEKVFIRRRSDAEITNLSVNWVVNCLGPTMQMNLSDPLISFLFEKGIVTFDALNMGLAVNEHGALMGKDNQPSSQFFTLGSPTKGTYWECSAVPEIRKQSHSLANFLG